MLTERAELIIQSGSEADFEAAMTRTGLALLKGLDGVRSVRFGRGVENPDKFMLLIEWETMEAHTAFTKDPRFPQFRALIGPFSKGGSMEHFNLNEASASV